MARDFLVSRSPNLNWGEIEAGQIYRSRKLSSHELAEQIQRHNLRSILCLAECTEAEKDIARSYGLRYYDQSVDIPNLQLANADRALQALKSGPFPMLVHCRKGADRTGFVAALYYMQFRSLEPKKAIRLGLRLRFGHLGRWATPEIYKVLDEFIGRHEL